ncbi:MAG TPA: DEAD/DEAH box helicase [bacterium]|nr:DEAD/DEAH box helicase [bacterium]HPG44659.1 DEAD/DEAH box helicase [bacterium]HPM99434.1 DEAD/DEAH box helicase [bacterium]
MTIDQVLDMMRRDAAFMQNVKAWQTFSAQNAEFADFPPQLDQRLIQALQKQGIRRPYRHQAEALALIEQHQHTTIVTPTASGKTLCYNLPVLNSILHNRESRALYLFPTKALSQDQMNELHELVKLLENQIDFDIKSYTFDGDTPADARQAIRSAGHIVVTNPDMLHTGILPHHTTWVKLFENLHYIVIDEIHQYRGVLGSHLANVLRRLKRICLFYGSRPQFICCSATIANPLELAQHLTGEKHCLVNRNGAPRGEKHFILYNPPVVNHELGIRRSSVKDANDIAAKFVRQGIQTIVFARSRVRVEILVTYLKAAMAQAQQSESLIRGYRGGYLPLQRREIERGLRDGSILGVVSTNALELGIDIGQLQVAIMAGYPGSIASSWQQAGRAGRKSDTSLAILVASSSPLDQYIVQHPDYLFGSNPESGIIDPDNLIILLSHMKCAAFELPFNSAEHFGADYAGQGGVEGTADILDFLQENRVVHRSGATYHWMSETYPAEAISLRNAAEENVVIIDRSDPQEKVIGEIDLFSAPMLVHDEAIYLHESVQYHVDRLDWERRKAYVKQVKVDYYTDAQMKSDLKILDISEDQIIQDQLFGYGEVVVTNLVTMYKKIKFNTHENVGWGKVHLPEQEMHTMAFWFAFAEDIAQKLNIDQQDLADGLQAVSHILGHVVPLFVMGDRSDIRALPMMRAPLWKRPAVFVWERYPGGVGFSRKLFSIYPEIATAARQVVAACPCASGCPSCVGPALMVGEKGKIVAQSLLLAMQETPTPTN